MKTKAVWIKKIKGKKIGKETRRRKRGPETRKGAQSFFL
jgi:hypothetical protein